MDTSECPASGNRLLHRQATPAGEALIDRAVASARSTSRRALELASKRPLSHRREQARGRLEPPAPRGCRRGGADTLGGRVSGGHGGSTPVKSIAMTKAPAWIGSTWRRQNVGMPGRRASARSARIASQVGTLDGDARGLSGGVVRANGHAHPVVHGGCQNWCASAQPDGPPEVVRREDARPPYA